MVLIEVLFEELRYERKSVLGAKVSADVGERWFGSGAGGSFS